MDLSTTYTHDSELQAITAPPLLSTIYKSPQHLLSLFPGCCVFISRSLATASNNGDSSASRAQVFSSQPLVQRRQKGHDRLHAEIITFPPKMIIYHLNGKSASM
jgi:hypothetical protein